MIRINLLPARVSRKKQAGRQQLALMAVAVVVILGGNVAWSRLRAAELASREQKIRQTRESIGRLERIIGEVKTIKAQQAAVKDKLAVLEKLKAGRQGPVRVLDELATIIPKKVWLRKFDERNGNATFEGSAETIDDVSLFLTALKQSRHFTSAELKKTAAKTAGRQTLVDFTITVHVNYTPGVRVASADPAPPTPAKR